MSSDLNLRESLSPLPAQEFGGRGGGEVVGTPFGEGVECNLPMLSSYPSW